MGKPYTERLGQSFRNSEWNKWDSLSPKEREYHEYKYQEKINQESDEDE